jgi:threonylcarbamoyladenosine tRNA methylthiotransferase MtaB
MAEARVVTLGCRVNAVEAEVIRRNAAAAGVSDTIVVNTCAVTSEAVRQARQTIRRLRRRNPGGRIVVTGCAAQLDPAAFAAMPEVALVLGNVEKLGTTALTDDGAQVRVADIMAVRETAGHLLAGFDGRTRAFAEIQQGCDHRCTFCIIPFARGPNRSVAPERIVDQVRLLVANGYPEVVLTGVDICSYGTDRPDGPGPGNPSLGALVRRLLADVPDLRRLRLSTLDPAAVDDELFHVFAGEPRLMPHWHLSLQAADDMVLKRMKRRHSRAQAGDVIARARQARPETLFGADVIAGFPTETDAMFANTLAAVEDWGLTFLHVFPYSPRPDTPAARMPPVAGPIRDARARRLREAGLASRRRVYAGRVGTDVSVLMETDGIGRCADYISVRLATPVPPGAVVNARATGWTDDHLIGEAI